MKLKKMLSAILALTMVLALSVPAFAETNDGTAATNLEISGTVTPATIAVEIPATGSVVVNPYKMEVTDPKNPTGAKITNQIVSATQYIENKGKVAVQVSASVTGTASTGVTFATAKHEGATKPVTTKSVFMYFEIGRTDDDSTEPTWNANGYDSKLNTQILVGTKAVAKTTMVTLAAGDGTDGQAKGFAAFRLAGDANPTPTTAWANTDTVTVNIAFTVLPTGTAVE